METLPETFKHDLVSIAIGAGKRILKVYNRTFDVEHKQDGSPLTQADKDAHHYIIDALAELTPQIPVISEESHKAGSGRCEQSVYWLVDPLDGTKEFIKRNGEFTVNIALIKNGRPVWGVVHAPVMDLTWYGGPEYGSVKLVNQSQSTVRTRAQPASSIVLAVSRSHLSDRTRKLFTALESAGHTLETVASGSSLKFCMIAEGQADCYPRLGLTSEWDTAAAEAVLAGAGGEVIRLSDGMPLDYNKADILNPEFIACGQLENTTRQAVLEWYQNGQD